MSQSSQCFRRLRLALAVIFVLALLPCPAVHAVETLSPGLRLAGLGEVFSPLLDLFSRVWTKEGGGLDPEGAPRGEAGGGLDPDGAPAASEEGGGLDPNGAR